MLRYRLALNLCRTFEELNETVTHRELMFWQAYSEIDPNGFWGANDPMSGLNGNGGLAIIDGTPDELSAQIDKHIFGGL